ncbi:MAG: ABC transporter permease subunit [Spirochaetaceae bacterium]|jgi:putative aldouronate transport system permease protein|nr:ABC transporter permease subunit [Spirochaetaceae bacterium]
MVQETTLGLAARRKRLLGYKEFLMVLPFLVLVFLFSYYPLYGWIYSFFDYRPPRPFRWSDFVGLQWFRSMVDTPVKRQIIGQVLINTLVMSGITLTTNWLPMLFAVFINEIKQVRYRKLVQTISTIPNFISWVLVYSIAFNIFSATGMVNQLLLDLKIIDTPIAFLQDSGPIVWWEQWLWLTWKNLGWAAIMYMAAIAGIDEQMYEAAKIDGATRMQQIMHITLPSLMPTYFVLTMIAIGNFLNNGMEQYFVFANSFNRENIQVLDLYVYTLAMGSGSYSVSVAISMLKSVVSVILIIVANTVSKAIRGEGVM